VCGCVPVRKIPEPNSPPLEPEWLREPKCGEQGTEREKCLSDGEKFHFLLQESKGRKRRRKSI